MFKKCFIKTLRPFVFLTALFLGGGDVCFGQTSPSLTIWPNGVGENPNLLVNSGFIGDVHPSQTLANRGREDSSYNIDMWKGYTSVVGTAGYYNYVSQLSDPLTGAYDFVGINHATITQQTSLVQFVENAVTSNLQGSVASLSFYAESVAGHIPAGGITGGVLCWTGTANVPIKPLPTSSWGASPQWSANWLPLTGIINTGILGTTWSYYKLENFAVPNSCKNLAVIFWTPGTTEAAGIEYHLANIKLEQGSTATAYKPLSISLENTMIYRYVSATYALIGVSNAAGSVVAASYNFPTEMLCASPAISLTGALTGFNFRTGTSYVQSPPVISSPFKSQFFAYLNLNNFNGNGGPAFQMGDTLIIPDTSYTKTYIVNSCEM